MKEKFVRQISNYTIRHKYQNINYYLRNYKKIHIPVMLDSCIVENQGMHDNKQSFLTVNAYITMCIMFDHISLNSPRPPLFFSLVAMYFSVKVKFNLKKLHCIKHEINITAYSPLNN